MARALIQLLVLAATAASLLTPLACQAAAATTCEDARRGHHQYRQPVGVRRIVVDAGGAGDFLSIQQAVDSVPANNSVRVIVQINAGSYM
jgi:pectin methylesterase-like acyl-CoA thioesterase